MSWLNLNESLNNIKGQISSFASGVLADGIVNDADPFTELSVANQKIQELQNLCASQKVEISSLRRQNAEFYEKLSFEKRSKTDNHEDNGGSNGENWFWDPPASEVTEANHKNSANSTISDLNNKIASLELEKKELIQNLEQLDLDCQQTTDRLVILKDNLQKDYSTLKYDYDVLKSKNDSLTKENNKHITELNACKVEIDKLKTFNNKLNSDIDLLKKNLGVNKNIPVQNSSEKFHGELKINFDKLSEENETLKRNYELSNVQCNKLQTDYDKIKMDFDKLKSETIPLDKHEKLKKDYEILENKFTELESKNKTANDKIQKVNILLEEMKLNETSKHQNNLSDDHKKLQDMYNELKNKFEEVLNDKLEMHRKYVNIMTETVKKYVDYQIPDNFVQKPNENIEISEFHSKVEAVLKLLLDFKWKTETLERKLCEISHEKTLAIAEKNHEIEKLLHNSEILSQEVITKTRTIKDYEVECSKLIKNNDLLIAELQQYKNNNGLQTISESNEDNLLLLETQLENANKRIRELTLAISDMENAKQDVALETQTELDYIKKQLNMTGNELSQSKKECQELSKQYEQCEIENSKLNTEVCHLKSVIDQFSNEKYELQSTVEKLKSEIENTEYKYTETNVDLETLREELECIKKDRLEVLNSKQNFEALNTELKNRISLFESQIDSLKSQLESATNIHNQMEQQARNLTEKLQSSKMSETGLKLQNDTIKKELDALSEIKINLETKLQKHDQHIFQIENAFQQLLINTELLKNSFVENENHSIIQKIDFLKNHLKFLENNISQQSQQICEKQIEKKHLIELEHEVKELKNQNMELFSVKEMFESDLMRCQNSIKSLETEILGYEHRLRIAVQEKSNLENNLDERDKLIKQRDTLVSELEQSNTLVEEMSSKISSLEKEINDLNISKTELVNLVTTKHQESIQYHTEIQRLNQIIAIETGKSKHLENQLTQINALNTPDKITTLEQKLVEFEKITGQNNFLREKCEKLTENLLNEQSNTQKIIVEKNLLAEKEQSLAKELERLRVHLIEIEDSYTRELLLAEQKNQEMLAKVNEIEQRERDSSTIYTSVSIRANQQVETLQNQLQLVTVQRDDLQKKISEAEDKNNKQFAALTNLQCVLEQFQREREKDITDETDRIRRQIILEKEKQNELQTEINTLKAQLEESKQGLKAAARLTEQMEKSKQQVLNMKDEVTKLQDQLSKTEGKYKALLNQTDAKVDKTLIRNLIIGFISSNNNLNKDQTQILKIIATVLDFNQQDNEKLKLSKTNSGSWLNAILHPQAVNTSSNMSQQSLSEAFVRFLESESQPKPIPPPLMHVRKMSTESNASNSSNTRHTPLLLNDVVLPTFADFAQNRNSSSILKDVLKDN